MNTRYYCGSNSNSNWTVFGWNLDFEPSMENECGYEQIIGPFSSYDNALDECPFPNDINWNLVLIKREKLQKIKTEKLQKEKEEAIIYFK